MAQQIPFEPYRIKVVEPISMTSPEERQALVVAAGYNPFLLESRHVIIDLLTDSGTGAMSDQQWAGMMMGDEAYAGSRSFHRLKEAVTDLMGFPMVIPTHQGRAAEHILFSVLVGQGSLVPNNMHFDTTKAHVQHQGGIALNLVTPEGYQPDHMAPFKGDMDVDSLDRLLTTDGDKVPLVLVTVTCNSAGGQPVSLANLQAVSVVCRRHGKLLFLDAARFAENAYFIQQREEACREMTVKQIARAMFDVVDGIVMSAKKDGLVNMGGLLCLRDPELYRRCSVYSILYEGFLTYGGLSGRDMEALAQGLSEVVDEAYLAHRIGQVAYLAHQLREGGVPIVEPPGGHAVYLDACRFLPHVPPDQFPAWALSVALYVEGGIRTAEIGTVLSGRDPQTGDHDYARLELVRLAIPRRVYTQTHLDYVAMVVRDLYAKADQLQGYRFIDEPPVLRHFSARFEPIGPA